MTAIPVGTFEPGTPEWQAVRARAVSPKGLKPGTPSYAAALRHCGVSPELVRFFAKVQFDRETGCWIWLASRSHNGYGLFGPSSRRRVRAHRWAYERFVGPIPEGLVLDHTCRRPACCNPVHLEPVTNQENLLRGDGPAGANARKTHCIHGHEFDAGNTGRDVRGNRFCKTCRNGWIAAKRRAA